MYAAIWYPKKVIAQNLLRLLSRLQPDCRLMHLILCPEKLDDISWQIIDPRWFVHTGAQANGDKWPHRMFQR